MRIARELQQNAVLATMVGVALAASFSSRAPVIHDPAKGVVPLTVNEVSFQIPQDYIPHRERRLYSDEAHIKDLRIEALWPAMTPFAGLADPGGYVPFYTNYRDQISIVLHAPRGRSQQDGNAFLVKFSNYWLPGREPMGESFGLARFSRRPGGIANSGNDELFLYPSRDNVQTMIVCAPETESEPLPRVPTQTGTETGFARPAGCEQGFFVPELNGLYVHVSYIRDHLKEWKQIQQSVIQLLDSLTTAAGVSTHKPTLVSAPKPAL